MRKYDTQISANRANPRGLSVRMLGLVAES
jgi:hypothetical protein